MAPGFLTEYRAATPAEIQNYKGIRIYLHRYMSPLLTYRCGHSLIVKTLSMRSDKVALFRPSKME
jgi:hypothetical protein